MAYNDYMDYGVGSYETEEERRKREEREAAERAAAMAPDQSDAETQRLIRQNEQSSGVPIGAEGGGFMDAVGNYAQRRFDRAMEPFTDPTAALNRRLGMTPEEAANTEVQTQTVKTYGDGSQEEITKRQIPAAGPVSPEQAAAPVPQTAPQQQTQQQKSPEEIARAAQALREMAGQRTPAPAVPTGMPAQGAITAEQAAAVPVMPQLPQPGPGVQVASTQPGAGVAEAARAAQAQATPVAPTPTTPTGAPQVGAPAAAPSLAQAGAQAQATARPQWAIDLEAAGNDQEKLIDIAANKNYPKDVRDDAIAKIRTAQDGRKAQQSAEQTVMAAAQGDPKAQQKLLNSIKPANIKREEEKGVTEGSYIRAYLYARLGLNDLAREEQEKIMGRTEYSQVSLGKEKYEVATNKRTGQIISARDNEGNPVDTPILNKIRAESLKVSTATPPSAGATRIRDSKGTEWSVVPTPQGSTFYNNKGEQGVPEGRTVPIAVGSDLEIAQAKEDMQTVAAFSRMTQQARLNAYENTNKRRADRGFPLLSLEEMGLRSDGSLLTEDVRRPGAGMTPPPAAPAVPAASAVPPPAATTTPPPAAPVQRPVIPTAQTTPPAQAAGTTPLVSTAGPTAGGGGIGRTPAGGIPTAQAMETAGKEGDLERSVREAEIKDRNKSNREYSDSLATSRQSAVAQNSTINRLQSSIDRNPEFWGIDTNSGVWRAYVDLNSTNADRAEALNTLARNLNIPKAKRAQFDQTMNDYRNLQVNAVTGSGLTASQTNTERESQRVMGTIGSISDRPAAAKATLEYAKAKIEYTDAKARAWADARKTNPGIDRLAFEANFDATTGEKIFKDANERMSRILGQAPGGTQEGQTSTSRSGRPIIFRNGRWEYQ